MWWLAFQIKLVWAFAIIYNFLLIIIGQQRKSFKYSEPHIPLLPNHDVCAGLLLLSVHCPPRMCHHMAVLEVRKVRKSEIASGCLCLCIPLMTVWVVHFLVSWCSKCISYYSQDGWKEAEKNGIIQGTPAPWPKSRLTFSLWSANSNLLPPWSETKARKQGASDFVPPLALQACIKLKQITQN